MKSCLTARHGLWNLWSVCRSECRSNYLNILRTALLNHRLACLLKWTCGGHQGTCLWQIYSLGESLPQFVSFCSILLPYKNKTIRRALLFSLCFSWVASGHTCFSKVKSKLAGPEAAPFWAQTNEMQVFTRSTSVQREKYKILFRPHPRPFQMQYLCSAVSQV